MICLICMVYTNRPRWETSTLVSVHRRSFSPVCLSLVVHVSHPELRLSVHQLCEGEVEPKNDVCPVYRHFAQLNSSTVVLRPVVSTNLGS